MSSFLVNATPEDLIIPIFATLVAFLGIHYALVMAERQHYKEELHALVHSRSRRLQNLLYRGLPPKLDAHQQLLIHAYMTMTKPSFTCNVHADDVGSTLALLVILSCIADEDARPRHVIAPNEDTLADTLRSLNTWATNFAIVVDDTQSKVLTVKSLNNTEIPITVSLTKPRRKDKEYRIFDKCVTSRDDQPNYVRLETERRST